MDDVRAVMDAAGSERAALLGMSEGATMCMLFAATYPERTSALVLWGAMARSTRADDYPWAPAKEALEEAQQELVAPLWGQGATIDIFSPSLADDPRAREFQARFERQAASPMRVQQLFQMFLDTDVRGVAAADPGADPGPAPPPATTPSTTAPRAGWPSRSRAAATSS